MDFEKSIFNGVNLQTLNKLYIKIIDFRRIYEKNFLNKNTSKILDYFVLQLINKDFIICKNYRINLRTRER